MGHCQEKLSHFSHMTPALESLIPLLIIWAFPHAPLPKGIWVLLVIKIAICSRFRLMLLEIMIIIYNTLSIILHSISFITKYSVLPTFPCWIFYSFSLFISSTVSSTPRRRMSSGEGCIEPWHANRATSHLRWRESHSLYRLLCSVSG